MRHARREGSIARGRSREKREGFVLMAVIFSIAIMSLVVIVAVTGGADEVGNRKTLVPDSEKLGVRYEELVQLTGLL